MKPVSCLPGGLEPMSPNTVNTYSAQVSTDKQRGTMTWQDRNGPHLCICRTWRKMNKTLSGTCWDMLYEESDVFTKDDCEIGCIPNLQLKIHLKDDTPVQTTYNSVPKSLYKEVKDYVQNLLDQGWISKSSYSSPWFVSRRRTRVNIGVLISEAWIRKPSLTATIFHASKTC